KLLWCATFAVTSVVRLISELMTNSISRIFKATRSHCTPRMHQTIIGTSCRRQVSASYSRPLDYLRLLRAALVNTAMAADTWTSRDRSAIPAAKRAAAQIYCGRSDNRGEALSEIVPAKQTVMH